MSMSDKASDDLVDDRAKAILAHGPNTAYISRASSKHVRDVIFALVRQSDSLRAQLAAAEAENAELKAQDDAWITTVRTQEEKLVATEAQLASARKALEEIAKEVFTDGTPTKAARTAIRSLKPDGGRK